MANCIVCGSENTKTLFPFKGHEVAECENCSVEFLTPQLTDEELTTLYSESYYDAWGFDQSQDSELQKMKQATGGLRMKRIKHYHKGGNLMDVGCASGYFLDLAERVGYSAFGVEFSTFSAELAQEKFGKDRVFNGILEDCTFPAESFEVITMFDLLEHVRNPNITVTKAKELLKPGGILMVTTPDQGSFSHMLMRKRWSHYKLEHLFYYDKKSLKYIAEKNGMNFLHSEGSKKGLSLEYVRQILRTYPHWLLTPMANFLYYIFPKSWQKKIFYVPLGEVTVVLQKP